jgi:hypothetical protein
MRRARHAAGLCALLLCGHGGLSASPLAEPDAFILRPTPKPFMPLLSSPGLPAGWYRLGPLDRIAADDRGNLPTIGIRRKTRHFTAQAAFVAVPLLAGQFRSFLDQPRNVLPRSRMTSLLLEDEVALDDRLSLRAGWSALKLSNGNANITVGRGRLKLKAHDWFMPRASVHLQAGQGIGLWLGYSQSMSAYGETGSAGPLGLTLGEFEALRDRLRPERRESLRLRAELDPAPGAHVAVSLYGGRVADRLAFGDHSYLPETIGSASVRGAAVRATMRVAPGMLWSVGYDQARFDPVAGAGAGAAVWERDLATEASWAGGPWRTSLRVARTSAPALLDAAQARRTSWRIETGIDYAALRIGRRSVTLFARLTEPSRLASANMPADDAPASLRAQDLARTAKLGTAMIF